MKQATETFYTDYRTAATWGGINLVMCNNIPAIDPNIYENNLDIFYDEETEEYKEVMQWFITDCSQWVTEGQKEVFGIDYVYSEVLDCYIMPVFHWGTSWDSVRCQVLDQDWINSNRDLEYKGL